MLEIFNALLQEVIMIDFSQPKDQTPDDLELTPEVFALGLTCRKFYVLLKSLFPEPIPLFIDCYEPVEDFLGPDYRLSNISLLQNSVQLTCSWHATFMVTVTGLRGSLGWRLGTACMRTSAELGR